MRPPNPHTKLRRTKDGLHFLRVPKRRETSIEQSICRALEKEGLVARKFKTMAYNSAPDRIVLVPGHIGLCFFLEVKRPDKPLTTKQREYREMLRWMGFICERVASVEEALKVWQTFQHVMRVRGVDVSVPRIKFTATGVDIAATAVMNGVAKPPR